MATRTMDGRTAISNYGFYAWIGILAVIVVVGFISFIRQTTDGHHLTGLNDAFPWGLYIAGFVFFVGASAGATIVGLMVHAFGRDDYAPLATRALLVGFLSLTAAVLFIAVDVGSIPRMLRMPFLWRNETSMFTYTSLTYYVFGILLLAELYYALKITRGEATESDRSLAKWLAIAAVPFALIVVHAPHGGLFAVVRARDFWSSPLLPPHFAVVALLSGTALMMCVAVLTSLVNGRDLVSKKTLAHMGGLLALFIAIAAFMDFFDLLVYQYSDDYAGNEAFKALWEAGWILSSLHVGGYAVALAIILLNRGRSTELLGVAAGIAVLAAAAYRFNLVAAGQAPELLPFLEDVSYSPSWVEISIAAGIVALITLAYSVATKVLPMEEPAGAHLSEPGAKM
ncbi:MAG TPA: NrfD/PsrC family molybdoenzyme membrane anchor subunit [Dehalococcoidia bacterium]